MAEAAQTQATDAEILLPDRDLKVKGEDITVHEFSFVEESRALPIAEPIIRELADLYQAGDDPDMITIEQIFSSHMQALFDLLSISTGKPAEWFTDMSGKDGNALYLTFWAVNSHFFTTRVVSQYIMMNRPEIKNPSTSD